MLLWFWYCKWRILADNSFATGCKRYEINSVNKVYWTNFIITKKSTVAPSNLNFTSFVGVNVLSHLSKF